jgi:phosphoglycerate dehydrogenase-like enzyme
MRIGFYAPEVEFANSILSELKTKFVNDIWTRWHPGTPPPTSDIEVLLALGPVTRDHKEQLPDLALIQTLSDGYEGVDVNAATELGIRVSYAPADVTGNSDSVAEDAVLLMLATARRFSVALTSIRDQSAKIPGRGHALVGANVCIVGMGSIGSKIALRLLTFGVNLNAVDLSPTHAPKYIPTTTPDRLKQAVANADFVVSAFAPR